MTAALDAPAPTFETFSTSATLPLSRFVEDVQVLAPPSGRALRVERLPDGRTSLVLRVLDEGRTADLIVAGPRTRAMFKSPTGVTRAVILRFKPGWSAALFGVPASALTNRIVPLEEIWGRAGSDLCSDLLAARGLPEVLARVADAVSRHARLAFESASVRLARQAARLLEADEVRVESVAERLGVTSRHLRRAFVESIGVGPKDFARSVRLQRAVRSAATSTDWSRIAADAGYYDQAHLIADFRELIGLTPGAFVKRS